MQKQVLARLGLVALGSLAMSCAPADSGSSVPDGTGGKTVGTGTGGAGATGSGGAGAAGSGGAGATGSGGAGPAGSGGAGATGSGGAGATGSGGAGATGSGGAGATGSGGAGATGTGGAGPAGSGGAGATGTGGAGPAGSGGAGPAGSGGAGAAGSGGAGATGNGGAGPAGSGGAGGGMGGTGGGSGDYWGGLKNPPRKSAGCDKPATITNGNKTIMSGGMQRTFIIDIPADYDPAKPYRLFYVSHGQGGRADDVAGFLNWFGVKAQATAAKEPAVFIAGQGLNNTWGQPDHVFFDDVTTFAKNGLCIDTTRVFVTGMSMGGMYTYSLSTDRQKAFRAGVGLAPTNFVIWLPNPKLRSDRLDADDRHERHDLRLGRRKQSRSRNTSPSRKPPTTGARFRRRFPLGRRVITSATTSPDASPGIPSKPAHSTAVTSTVIATPART